MGDLSWALQAGASAGPAPPRREMGRGEHAVPFSWPLHTALTAGQPTRNADCRQTRKPTVSKRGASGAAGTSVALPLLLCFKTNLSCLCFLNLRLPGRPEDFHLM